MDSKELRGLMEAYSEVYAPQEELDEAEGSYGETPKAYSAASKTKMTAKRKPFLKAMQRRTNPANRTSAYSSPRKGMTADDRERARAGSKHGVGTRDDHDYPSEGPGGVTKNPKKLRKQKAMGEFAKEEFDIFDEVLEFLQVEGYAETLEEAEWVMANLIDEEAIDIILGEAITSEKGKAKAAEMIAKRTTASGRAKSGQGANVAMIKHIGRSNRDGLLGTPPNRKVAGSNWPKSYTGIGGTGNKAARRAAELKKEDFELWVNELVEEGYDLSDYTWDEMYDIYEAEKPFPYEKVKAKQVALRDKGSAGLDRRMKMGAAVRRAKEAEKTGGSQRDAGKGWYHAKEAFESWLDEAMSNYEKNRKRAAQRAAARNAARDQGKTGAVPGVGYVTPRRERETWTDESGKTRHAKGL